MADTDDQPLAQRRGTSGILRIDVSPKIKKHPHQVEMMTLDANINKGEPVSPQPSIDRLSVTFASETPACEISGKSPQKGQQQQEANEKVRFQAEPIPEQDFDGKELPENEDDDDEYSASVSAIMSRTASTRRSGRRKSASGALGRRPSSPFSPDVDSEGLRRRSSIFTTSSAESGLSTAEENTAQEMIFHKMKIHKEVLSQIKYQPWPMRKKIRLVQTAKAYIKRHEGALQERLAQKKSTKDIVEHVNIILIKQWHKLKRELTNLSNNMIPWEKRIKQIESHFGSVVASYFTFLRWLFWVNLVSAMALVLLVAIPEIVFGNTKNSGERKELLPDEEKTATNLVTLWNFQGALKYSPFFYGYYMSDEEDDHEGKQFRFRLPTAYFVTGMGVYIYSFIAILRKMAENSRQSKLSEKEDECVFSWKVFTAWDYMIGNPETAHNRTASIILGFKEVLLEEAEKNRQDGRNWKMTLLRTFANFLVVCLIVASVYAVVKVVRRSLDPEVDNWLGQSEVTLVFTIIGFIYPMLFDAIGYMERYHPRKALRMQLARIMVLNLLNLYSFIFATFSQIDRMSERSQALKPNISQAWPSTMPTTTAGPVSSTTTNIPTNCYKVFVGCNTTISTVGLATLLVANLSTTSPLSENSLTPNITTEFPPAMNFTDTMSSNVSWDDGFSITDKEIEEFWKELSNTTNAYSNTTWTELGNVSSVWPFEFLFSKFYPSNHTMEETNHTHSTETHFENATSTAAPLSEETGNQFFGNVSKAPGEEIEESDCFVIRCHGLEHTILTPKLSTAFFPNGTNSSSTVPYEEPDAPEEDMSTQTEKMDLKTRKELRDLCWETMFGQELVKLTVMDLVATVSSILMMDFFRALFVRVMNHCWCWDLEKTFPLYGDFKIAENILHLVNNQGMVWMGMFFSPLLPLINIFKLIIILYMR
ncbi:TMC domain [Nesidiocoris tenuis]|uniref:TMC domain n=1 Tax=Nesidiocoris tenuis TaxID=355587 RepID=A0ABN7B223_9HEMI|nr:TMC domain [Nesidiocoris tenuis]